MTLKDILYGDLALRNVISMQEERVFKMFSLQLQMTPIKVKPKLRHLELLMTVNFLSARIDREMAERRSALLLKWII